MTFTLPDRFWDKVQMEPNTGCWLWDGHVGANGYGQIKGKLKVMGAHRFSYEGHIGQIPDGLDLDHLCRVRSCVNPAHLEPVTRKENARRGLRGMKTHCPQGHPYSGENLYVYSNGHRRCKKCRTDGMKRLTATEALERSNVVKLKGI